MCQECHICFDLKILSTLSCNHSLCEDCLVKIFTLKQALCPFYREKINPLLNPDLQWIDCNMVDVSSISIKTESLLLDKVSD
jgi:hypothetical protein